MRSICSRRSLFRPYLAIIVACVIVFLAAACGASDNVASNPTASEADELTSALADEAEGCGTQEEFDAANFVDPTLGTNPFHPTTPGLQWVRGGTTLVGGREVPHQVITTITDVIRVIDGVPAVAMLDESTDSGEVAQVGMDYLGLDSGGNVWLLGGYTEEYEGGEYTNIEGAWLGAEDDRTLGILSPSMVTAQTPRWCILSEGDEGETAAIIETGASECVAFACYEDVRIVEEGEVGAPDNEHKYYAPGVGVIKNVPLDASLHKDRFELLNLIELTPDGLREASDAVLVLEEHARTTAPSVFDGTPISERAG